MFFCAWTSPGHRHNIVSTVALWFAETYIANIYVDDWVGHRLRSENETWWLMGQMNVVFEANPQILPSPNPRSQEFKKQRRHWECRWSCLRSKRWYWWWWCQQLWGGGGMNAGATINSRAGMTGRPLTGGPAGCTAPRPPRSPCGIAHGGGGEGEGNELENVPNRPHSMTLKYFIKALDVHSVCTHTHTNWLCTLQHK